MPIDFTLTNGLTSTAGIQQKNNTAAAQGVPWWGTFSPSLGGGGAAASPGQYGFVSPPTPWDVVLYGPMLTPLPGLARVRRCERRMKLHRKEHPSSDFEDQTFQGWSVVEFDFDLEMWTSEHLVALQTALPVIFPGAGDPPSPQSNQTVATIASSYNIVNPTNNQAQSGGSKLSENGSVVQIQTAPNVSKRPPIPIKLQHPDLQLHGVQYVVILAMEGPRQKSEQIPDIFIARFRTVQFKPAKSVQQNGTLKRPPNTLATGLGANPGPGIPGAQQPQIGPSAGGGADPTNYLPASVAAAIAPFT